MKTSLSLFTMAVVTCLAPLSAQAQITDDDFLVDSSSSVSARSESSGNSSDAFYQALDEAAGINGNRPQPAPKRESAPVATRSVHDEDAEQLKGQTQLLHIDNEIADVETDSYEQYLDQEVVELKRLKGEVAALERQVAAAKSGAERAKKKIALAEKRVEFERHRKSEMSTRVKHSSALRQKEERRLQNLKASADELAKKAKVAAERNRTDEKALLRLQLEKRALEKRLRIASNRLESEARRQKMLRDRRAKLSRENQALKAKLGKAQRKLAAGR